MLLTSSKINFHYALDRLAKLQGRVKNKCSEEWGIDLLEKVFSVYIDLSFLAIL